MGMSIGELRHEIEDIDLEIAKLLASRFFLCTCIGIEKKKNGMSVLDEKVKHSAGKIYSKVLGEYGEAIYETIHEQSVKIQSKL